MHCSADNRFRTCKSIELGGALAATLLSFALMSSTLKAYATPNFARQTGRSCNVCHSGAPRLNDTGMAFKNNGFRFPDSDEAPDKDHKDAPAQ